MDPVGYAGAAAAAAPGVAVTVYVASSYVAAVGHRAADARREGNRAMA